ncbi:hypothetical protein LTR53_008113 [Teratosphaeriaceae sp. CCFEE 6253]|nr:hypothetical protein LTR53_008113 [Teratosphaeriaceae sp. CCFEE 6253]
MPPKATSAASGTPGPTTRARSSRQNTPQPAPAARPRPTALPAVSVGTSSGYGAPGKPTIGAQIATSTTTLSSVLQTARARTPAPAIEEADEEESPPSSPAPAPSRRAEMTTAAAASGRQQGARAGATARPASVAGGDDVAGTPRVVTFVDGQQQYGARDPPRASPEYEPGRAALLRRTVPRFVPAAATNAGDEIWSVFWSMFLTAFYFAGMFSIFYGFVYCMTMNSVWAPIGERFSVYMHRQFVGNPHSLPPSELETLWLKFRMDTTISKLLNDKDFYETFNKTRLDMLQTHKLTDHEYRIKELERKGKLHEASVTALEKMLPQTIIVQKTDGQWEIPEYFWEALQQKLEGRESAPLWDAFLRANGLAVEGMVDKAADLRLQYLIRDGHIVSGTMFVEAVQKNYEWLETHFKDEMRKVEYGINADIRRIATETTTELIANTHSNFFSSKELELLAKANQVRASYEAIRQVNFFAVGLGALVDPHLSSPTYKKGGRSFNWFGKSGTIINDPHPPIAALQRWEEADDCWCAAPSTEMGKAQLTVRMTHEMYPEWLHIEHIPASGTLDIKTAPRLFEIWAERLPNSPNSAAQLQQSFIESSGVPIQCEGAPPTPEHICIGHGQYDIHNPKTVQSSRIYGNMDLMGFAIKTATVRVTANWGGHATCLYRVRMTGRRVHVGLPESDGEKHVATSWY